MKRILIFTILIYLFLPFQVWAADFTVNQAGDDGKDYSAATFNALSGDKNGNTYYFSGTFTTRITVNIYGTSANQVILDGYQAGTCDPTASDYTSSACYNNQANLDYGMESNGKSYLTVKDFNIENISSSCIANLSLAYVDHAIIEDNYIHNAASRCFSTTSGQGQYQILDNNYMVDAAQRCGPENVVASLMCDNMLAKNNIFDGSGTVYGSSMNTVTMHDSSYILFEYNTVRNAPEQAGIAVKESANTGSTPNEYHVYRFNKVHDNPTGGGFNMGGGWDYNNYFYIYGNLFYDNGAAMVSYDGGAYHYWWSNVAYDNVGSGFYTWNRSQGSLNYIYVYNNTFEGNCTHATYVNSTGSEPSTGSNINIKNNIYYNNRPAGYNSRYQQVYDHASATYDYNTYYHTSTANDATVDFWYYGGGFKNLTEIQAASQEANGAIEDPKFTYTDGNDYTLQSDSPCIDDGVDLSQCFSVALSGGDTWFETNSGYTTVVVCLDDALDPANTDWSTTPPTVVTVKQDDYALWERGAYAYTGAGPGETNEAPNGTIASPGSNPVIDEDATVSLAGTYSDPDGDTCTYVWVIEAETFKEWDGATTYDAADIVEDPDAGDSGDFYKSKAGSNLNHEPPNATYWDNAETQATPGTGVCDTAGVYSVTLTVNDGTVNDPSPASISITVNDPGGGSSPTTEIWSRNTTGAYTGDYAQGDTNFINGEYKTEQNGTNVQILIQAKPTDSWHCKGFMSVDLSDIAAETVTDATIGLRLNSNPHLYNTNIEIWSCSDAFVESESTWNIYSTGNSWTGTHGISTFLAETAFTTSSSEGVFYTWSSNELTSYVASKAGSTAYFILIGDVQNTYTYFSSDDATDGNRPYLEVSYGASDPGSVPEIVSINIPLWEATYKENDTIPAPTITFNEPVVGTSLVLTLDTDSDGANDATSAYTSGSGTATYTLTAITVTADHHTTSLDSLTLDTPAGVIAATDDATEVPETADEIDTIPLGATAGSLAYNTDIGIYTTAPAIDGINNTDALASSDATYTTENEMIKFVIETNTLLLEITAEPSYPRILTTAISPNGPVYAPCLGLATTTDHMLYGWPLFIGTRVLDLSTSGDLDYGPGGDITDTSGNSLVASMGALDLSAGAAIVLASHTTAASPWVISSDTYYTTLALVDAATYLLPDDYFKWSNDTVDVFDVSAHDGTSGHEITYDGNGYAITGNQTYGDYSILKNMIHGSTVILGANNVYTGSLTPVGDTLEISATGCDIYNSGIGTLDLNESIDGIYGTWIAVVDAVGTNGKTVKFYNCRFVESEAVVQGKFDAAGGTVVFDGDCKFEIATGTIFTNYAGGDFTLKPSSSFRHGGTHTSGHESKLNPSARTMDDILSVGPYGVHRGSAGM